MYKASTAIYAQEGGEETRFEQKKWLKAPLTSGEVYRVQALDPRNLRTSVTVTDIGLRFISGL